MKFIFTLLLVTSGAFAQDLERCSSVQMQNLRKASKKICNEHVTEFALRSSANCLVSKYELNVCRALCKDEEKKPLAALRVDMIRDCGRELVHYQRMGIRYFR